MDKYEYRIKAEQIRKLVEQEEYATAMKIANTIDWNRVKSVPMLCLIGEIYEKNGMLEESRDVMLIAYERHPYGRMIIYSLAELSIQLKEYVDAVEYYKEFVQVAPRDTGRYILQYKLYEAQEVGLEERIAVLEEFKRHDYIEKWAFELAYMYHRAGYGDKCVAECDEIILWFSEGKYVEKAMELKMLYQPLTPEQQVKYESRNDVQIEKSIAAVEEIAEKAMSEESIEIKPLNLGIYDTVNLQAELAKSMQQIMAATEKETIESTMDNIKKMVEESKIEGLLSEKTRIQEPVDDNMIKSHREDKREAGNQTETPESSDLSEKQQQEEAAELQQENEVPEKPQNEEAAELQQELAESVSQIEGLKKSNREPDDNATQTEEDEILPEVENLVNIEKTKEILFANMDAPTKRIPSKEIESALLETGAKTIETPKTETAGNGPAEDVDEEAMNISLSVELEEESKSEIEQKPEPEVIEELTEHKEIPEQKASEDVLEKQITGQMSIEEVLAEWEKMKKAAVQNEQNEQNLEDVKQKALQETEDIMDRLADVVPKVKEPAAMPMPNGQTEEIRISPESISDILRSEMPAYRSQINEERAETEEVESLDELDTFGKAEEPDDGDAAVDLESKLEAALPEGISTLAEKEKKKHRKKEAETSVQEKPPASEENEEKPVRELAEEYRRIFTHFAEVDGVSRQLSEVLDVIEDIPARGNVVIMGDSATGKTTLAIDIVKAIQKSKNLKNGKIAKITGEALNHKDINLMVKKIVGGVLIVENAGRLTEKTIKKLSEALDKETKELLIILEDRKDRINKLLAKDESFAEKFPGRVEIPPYTNDDLVSFGKSYAKELEYVIDEMGVLALYTRIAEIQIDDHIPSLAEVKEIIDEAIQNANKKNIKNIVDTIFAKRYDEDNYLILHERDFQ